MSSFESGRARWRSSVAINQTTCSRGLLRSTSSDWSLSPWLNRDIDSPRRLADISLVDSFGSVYAELRGLREGSERMRSTTMPHIIRARRQVCTFYSAQDSIERQNECDLRFCLQYYARTMSDPGLKLMTVNTAPERAARLISRVIQALDPEYNIRHVDNCQSKFTTCRHWTEFLLTTKGVDEVTMKTAQHQPQLLVRVTPIADCHSVSLSICCRGTADICIHVE